MKVICNQHDLLNALTAVSRIVPGNTTLPVLQYIKILCKDNSIKVYATNLNMGIEYVIPATVTENGSYLINSRMLLDIVRKLPSDNISMETEDLSKIEIKSQNIRVNIKGYDSSEFPEISFGNQMHYIEFEKETLNKIIDHVLVSIKRQDDTNPILTGALFEISDNKITSIGLDGYRVSMIKRNIKDSQDGRLIVDEIVPRRALEEVSYIAKNTSDEKIIMGFDKNRVYFMFNNVKMYSNLIDGKYINYKSVIPDKNGMGIKVEINKGDLINSVELASLIASQNKNKMIKISVRDGFIEITSASELGDFYRKIDCSISGKELEIAFNSVYVMDALRSIESEFVTLYFEESLKPCIITPQNEDDLHMLLPVRM